MNIKLFTLLISVVTVSAGISLYLADSSDGDVVHTYEHPDTIKLDFNDPTYTLRITDDFTTEVARAVIGSGRGSVVSNFPSWITYDVSHFGGGYLEIYINGAYAGDYDFWMYMDLDNKGNLFYVKFRLTVTEEGDPGWGGDDPNDPIDPDGSGDGDNTIYIPIKSGWDMLAEIMSNTDFLILMAGGFLSVCVLLRIVRTSKRGEE